MSRIVQIMMLAALAGCARQAEVTPPEHLWPRTPAPVIHADLVTASFDSVLPFAKRFVLRVALPESTDSMRVRYAPYECLKAGAPARGDCAATTLTETATPLIENTQFPAPVDALAPDRAYLFEFQVWGKRKNGDGDDPQLVMDRREIVGWTTTAPRHHFDADFGMMYGAQTGYTGAGMMIHWYAQPIQSDEEFDEVSSAWRRLLKRVNVGAGMSLVKITSRVPVEDKFSFGTPVAGIGVRRLGSPHWFPGWLREAIALPRWNAGVIWFDQEDPNALVPRKRTRADMFASMTLDADFLNMLAPVLAVVGISGQ